MYFRSNLITMSVNQSTPGLGKQAQKEGGAREADCPRAFYSEWPQIVRALFLRIPQNAKGLTPE